MAASIQGIRRDAVVQLTTEVVDLIGEAARWAPSIHNSQPWHLHRLADGLAVFADAARALPVIDPSGRALSISCGAAVFNARVALGALGHRTDVEILPDPDRPDLIAVIRSVGPRAADPDDVALADAVRHRHTHRRVYRSHAIAEDDLLELHQAVHQEGARLTVADAAGRRRLIPLLREAVQVQAADAALRAEIERWVRRDGEAPDGIPSSALGTSPYPVDSLVHAGHGGAPDAADVEAELARSTLLAISTPGDTRRDWVIAGLALEHLLLAATRHGLVATFTDQALQIATMRPQVAEVLGIEGWPQALIRVGRPLVEAPPTPRRPLHELFV